jgi:hypothetical protein
MVATTTTYRADLYVDAEIKSAVRIDVEGRLDGHRKDQDKVRRVMRDRLAVLHKVYPDAKDIALVLKLGHGLLLREEWLA